MALLWFSSKKWSWLLKSVFQVFELNIMNIIEDFKRYFQTGRAKTPISILYQYISSKLVILICLCSTINYFTARGCLIFLNNKSFKNEPESTCTWMLRFFFFFFGNRFYEWSYGYRFPQKTQSLYWWGCGSPPGCHVSRFQISLIAEEKITKNIN